jgi:hypothetical protein
MLHKKTFRKMILAAVMAFSLGLLLATPARVRAQASDPETVINTWQEALRVGNVDGALAVFTDDVVVNLIPPPPNMDGVLVGKDALRGWFEGQIALNRVVEVKNLQVDGDQVTWQETYSDDSLKPMGITELELVLEAVVKDGFIHSYTATLTQESLAKLQAIMPPQNLPQSGGPGLPAYVGWLAAVGLGMLGLGWSLSRKAKYRTGSR